MNNLSLYEQIFNASNTPMLIHKFDGHGKLELIDINQSALYILGYSEEDIYQLNPDEYLSPEYIDYIYSDTNTSSHATSDCLNSCCKNKSGLKILKDATITKIHHNGNTYYISSSNKIFDHQELLNKLIEKNDSLNLTNIQLDLALKSSKIMMNICNLDGTTVYPHPNFCSLTGYTNEELQKLPFTELSLSEELEVEFPKFQQLLDGKIDSYEMEKRIICKDREIKWIYVNCTLIKDSNQKPVHILTYIKDISEEKYLLQTQEKYKKLVELLPDGVIISKNGICLFANESAGKLLGYESSASLIGENLIPFLHPDCQKDIASRKKTLYTQSDALPFIEQKVIKKDGSLAYVEAASIPLYYKNQWAGLTVMRDITDSKKIANKLKNSNDQLQLYILENDVLLYELRRFRHNYINVLHGMRGYIDDYDWDGLNQYFEYLVGEIQEIKNMHILSIQRIKNLSLRGLLTAKIKESKNLQIHTQIEVLRDINISEEEIKSVDLCEIVGIFLDNSIEAAQESTDPKLNICIYDDLHSITIIIENTYKEKPNMTLLHTGYSTKGSNHGAGLTLTTNILSRYPHVLNNTMIQNDLFIQELHINKK